MDIWVPSRKVSPTWTSNKWFFSICLYKDTYVSIFQKSCLQPLNTKVLITSLKVFIDSIVKGLVPLNNIGLAGPYSSVDTTESLSLSVGLLLHGEEVVSYTVHLGVWGITWTANFVADEFDFGESWRSAQVDSHPPEHENGNNTWHLGPVTRSGMPHITRCQEAHRQTDEHINKQTKLLSITSDENHRGQVLTSDSEPSHMGNSK